MNIDKVKLLIQLLKNKGIVFEKGLSENEILKIEKIFDFSFPPDLKFFLQIALPISDSFVHWRTALTSKEEFDKTLSRLNWPLEGMLFDVQSNEFWLDAWGEKPKDHESQVQIAKRHYNSYPKLIPIYSHRYIPIRPNESGNPIFSVYQMDIVCYGFDLTTYFANEFNLVFPSNWETLKEPKLAIEFWSDCNNF